MNDVATHLIFLVGYILLFVFGVAGFWFWRAMRRGERPPVEFRLLRGPGESLRRRMLRADEEMTFIMIGAAFVPLVVGVLTRWLLVWLAPHLRLAFGLAIMAVPTLVVLFYVGRYCLERLTRYRHDRLSYLGERAVGEVLAPLVAGGYAVFHDVPAAVGVKKFNIDHVAVGSNGVFAIETKTRRKGRTRPGLEKHQVAYDGRQLIWPWGEESVALKQAQDQAWWLNDWLNKMVGVNVVAQPVLALPGWHVMDGGSGPVLVVDHRQLPEAIARSPGRALSTEEIDLIARQLDNLCRDVED